MPGYTQIIEDKASISYFGKLETNMQDNTLQVKKVMLGVKKEAYQYILKKDTLKENHVFMLKRN